MPQNTQANTAVTDENGAAKYILPLGAYVANASTDEYSSSVGVMSTGVNAKYTVVIGELKAEPVTTGIDQVSGNTIFASTNGESLKLYAAKYNNGVLTNVALFDTEQGTSYYNAGFEPDRVFLWNAMQKPIDVWTE